MAVDPSFLLLGERKGDMTSSHRGLLYQCHVNEIDTASIVIISVHVLVGSGC